MFISNIGFRTNGYLDNCKIWLISKNDGQLYALDVEPDEALARRQDRDKTIGNSSDVCSLIQKNKGCKSCGRTDN